MISDGGVEATTELDHDVGGVRVASFSNKVTEGVDIIVNRTIPLEVGGTFQDEGSSFLLTQGEELFAKVFSKVVPSCVRRGTFLNELKDPAGP